MPIKKSRIDNTGHAQSDVKVGLHVRKFKVVLHARAKFILQGSSNVPNIPQVGL